MSTRIEACVTNIESALTAQDAGADRIELCSALAVGGLTPSFGLIEAVQKSLTIPIHVLIRPREGDFGFSSSEFELMKQDVLKCKELGVAGVVIGMLRADGSIDVSRSAELISAAAPLSVTFHRAFDFTSDVFNALEELIRLGCERVLTSGQRSSAIQGASLISGLVRQSAGRMIVMPGGGINENNIAKLKQVTGANEFHLSARMKKESGMLYRNEFVKLSTDDTDEYAYDVLDGERLKNVKQNANQAS